MIVARGLARLASPLAWRAALVLLAACAVLRQFAALSAPMVSYAPPVAAPRVLPLQARPPHAATAYPAIAQHPLFSPTRRPWIPLPAPPVRAAAPPAPPGSFTVIGTVIGGGVRRAIVRPPNGDKTIVLREGQMLQGWTLRRIGRERLHFENDGASYELRFAPPAPGQVTQAGR